jgi:hypothetical protein
MSSPSSLITLVNKISKHLNIDTFGNTLKPKRPSLITMHSLFFIKALTAVFALLPTALGVPIEASESDSSGFELSTDDLDYLFRLIPIPETGYQPNMTELAQLPSHDKFSEATDDTPTEEALTPTTASSRAVRDLTKRAASFQATATGTHNCPQGGQLYRVQSYEYDYSETLHKIISSYNIQNAETRRVKSDTKLSVSHSFTQSYGDIICCYVVGHDVNFSYFYGYPSLGAGPSMYETCVHVGQSGSCTTTGNRACTEVSGSLTYRYAP